MTRRATFEVANELGLHARAATLFVQLASRFQSEVWVTKDGREANGKSIMGVLMLVANRGAQIEVRAEGPDEDALIEAIGALVTQKFGEG